MKKADNIFVRAKAYRKQHPRTSFQDAIKKVSGKRKVSGTPKVSGVKKRKVSGTPKVKVASASQKKAIGSLGTVSGFSKAKSLQSKIDRLETKRASESRKVYKDIIQLEINAKERQLAALMSKLNRA